MSFAFQASSWASQIIQSVRGAIWDSFTSLLSSISAQLPYIIAGVIVMLFFWLLSKLVRKAFLATTRKTKLDIRLRLLISRLIVAVVYLIGIFTALSVVIPSFDLGSVIAGLGFTSFVIGFAAKDIVNNFISGILILWQRPFHIGDYIFVGGNQGKVEHIGVRATNLRKDDGELVLIPNGDMYSSALTIREAGEPRRMAVKLILPHHSDIEQAKKLILDAITAKQSIVNDPSPSVLSSDVIEEGVVVKATFWIDTKENKPLRVLDKAIVAISRTLIAEGIAPFVAEVEDPSRKQELRDKRKKEAEETNE